MRRIDRHLRYLENYRSSECDNLHPSGSLWGGSCREVRIGLLGATKCNRTSYFKSNDQILYGHFTKAILKSAYEAGTARSIHAR